MLVVVMQTFHVVGLAIMFMNVLPELNVVQGAMLTNCVCFVPGLFGRSLQNLPKSIIDRHVGTDFFRTTLTENKLQ